MNDAEILAIEHRCARLVALYANLNDEADWEGVAGLYIENGRFSRPSAPDDWIEGQAAILAAFRQRPARRARHLCTNVVIDVLSVQSATGVCAMALFAEGQPPMVGSFCDRFENTASGWKFAERRGFIVY